MSHVESVQTILRWKILHDHQGLSEIVKVDHKIFVVAFNNHD